MGVSIADSPDEINADVDIVDTSEDEESEIRDLSTRIKATILWYERSGVKGALELLHNIQDIEQQHKENKLAHVEENWLHSSFSKKYIEEQIKLSEALPVEELYSKAKELIGKITHVDHHRTSSRATAVNTG